jgi:hypothetical protein
MGLRPITPDKRELHVFVDGRWVGDAYRASMPDVPSEHRGAIRYVEQEHRSLQGSIASCPTSSTTTSRLSYSGLRLRASSTSSTTNGDPPITSSRCSTAPTGKPPS